MQAVNRALVMLLVLLFAPYAAMASSSAVSEVDLLEIAETHWHAIEPSAKEASSLKIVDYNIHLESGSFDPMVDVIPNSRADNPTDYRSTGMAIIQLNEHTGEALYDLVEEFEVFVLDHLGGSAWLVRLDSPNDFSLIGKDPSVRWIGAMNPGWRIAQDLDSNSDFIAIIPAADLIPEALEGLAHDLVMMGADEAWCGTHLCEARGNINLGTLARDGRVIWSEPTFELKLTNAVARAVVGVENIAANTSLNLDGTGEIISFTDTGLDQDHPDINGRVAAVYTQFGLDPSPADANGGHGTHIALTIAGDGSSDSSTKGIAPSANIIVYALEHDPTGTFGRLGSIYDMLRHAEQEGSRVAVNAWGLNGNQGQYTADSRSLDTFVNDNPSFLPIFSAGDDVYQNSSMVLAPSTAKNVLSVGASTTSPSGEVSNFSAFGPALDGRVKPDLVAPGVNICSGRAEEALSPIGFTCGTGTHANNGDPLYMSLSGSSQATAVTGGTISLIRQYLREDVGVSTPTASLLKAVSINSAEDLGTPDIPNSQEGWGQISLERAVMPSDGSTQLQTFYDNSRILESGFSSIYAFEIDPSHGLDITLAWSDIAGSAQTSQSESKLVNDLDLILYAPDGTIYNGNVFVNGLSVPNGANDDVNNVERIRFAPGTIAPSGTWQLKVTHSGGLDQAYSLVVTGDATLNPEIDLTVFVGSIYPSSESPLVNDYITIRLSWYNQGTLAAGSFRVILEDLTAGTELYNNSRSGLDAGALDSVTIYHTFTTIGDHEMRLTVDSEDVVSEINDGTTGTDNNIRTRIITVSALGVRLLALDGAGNVDSSMVNKSLDPSVDEGMTWPVMLRHEGTDVQNVVLSITQVQIPNPQRDDLFLPPEDTWSRYSDIEGPFTMQPINSEGDELYLNITMNDDDADLNNPNNPRYAMAGTYVVDVIARYQNSPTVSHSIRLRLVVEEVKDVLVVSAGTVGLEAVPGGTTSFAISVMNVGNSPATYEIDCVSQNRWQIELGSSNSSSYSFEPLDLLEYLPLQVRLYVPSVVDGLPASGSSDNISCSVTSESDLSLNYTESVELTVKTLRSFSTILSEEDGTEIGLASLGHTISVDTSQLVIMNHSIINTGNTKLSISVRIDSELTSWAVELNHSGTTDPTEVTFDVEPGETEIVNCLILVSQVAQRSESNRIIFTTSAGGSSVVYNETTFIVQEDLSIALTPQSSTFDVLVNGEWSYAEFDVVNTGNSIISLEWSHTLAPDGWQVGYKSPPSILSPLENATVRIGVIPPINEPAGISSFNLGIYADASNQWQSISEQTSLMINILETPAVNISQLENDESLFSIPRDESVTQDIQITNTGNIPFTGTIGVDIFECPSTAECVRSDGITSSDWTATTNEDSIQNLEIGESVVVTVTISPDSDAESGIVNVRLIIATESNNFTNDIEVSVETSVQQGGLFGGMMPTWLAATILAVIIMAVIVVAVIIKRSAPKGNSVMELLTPDSHERPDDGLRRDAIMDSGTATDDLTSGSVSADEIASALAQSIPSLPPPVPAGRPPSAKFEVPMGRPPAPTPAPNPSTQITYNITQNIQDSVVSKTSVGVPQPSISASLPVPVAPPGPPLPPTGLPPGWTMEQWQHYGNQWLAQQGQK